jgi:hypothetical protein
MLNTLAEHTPRVVALTREAISSWNGVDVLRQPLCQSG